MVKEFKFFFKGMALVAIAGITYFLVAWVGFDLSIWKTLLVSFVGSMFGVGYVVYRSIKMATKRFEKDPTEQHVYTTLKEVKHILRTIRKQINTLSYTKQFSLLKLYKSLDHVYQLVKDNPAKFGQARKFFKNDLLTIQKVVEQYVFLEMQPVRTVEMNEALVRTETLIKELNQRVKEQGVQLVESDLLELTVELDYMDQNFKK